MDTDADAEIDLTGESDTKSSGASANTAKNAKSSDSGAQAEMEAEEDVFPSTKIGSHLSRNYDEKTSRNPGYICGGEVSVVCLFSLS